MRTPWGRYGDAVVTPWGGVLQYLPQGVHPQQRTDGHQHALSPRHAVRPAPHLRARGVAAVLRAQRVAQRHRDGPERHNTARHNTARHGPAQHGPALHGPARPGTTRPGTTRPGTTRPGTTRHNTARHNTARHNTARPGAAHDARPAPVPSHHSAAPLRLSALPSPPPVGAVGHFQLERTDAAQHRAAPRPSPRVTRTALPARRYPHGVTRMALPAWR